MTTTPLGGGVVVSGRYAAEVAEGVRFYLRHARVARPAPEVARLLDELDEAGHRYSELAAMLDEARVALGARATGPTGANGATPAGTMSRTMTSGAVADHLGVTPQRARQLLAAGRWPSATRTAHGWVVDAVDLREESA